MTTKYLKITNRSGLVPRINLEKLGLSTKRNDPSTIGQFGSGIKFAPIAALRNGWEWWFTGQDSKGHYKMQYSTEVEDGVECIVYDYGDYRKSSSFTADAGSLSWVNPFQIYREAVANAFDESSSPEDWSISVVEAEDICSVDNEFSVYITAAPELMQIHNNFHKYFAIDREILYSSSAYSDSIDFMPKVDNSLRIYCHRVLVYQTDDYSSVYDYNIDGISLNEERTVSSLYTVEYALSNALLRLSDQKICSSIIKYSTDNADQPFELTRFNNSVLSYHDANISWTRAFESIYGDMAVIYDDFGGKLGAKDSIQLRGRKPVYIASNSLYHILKSAGVESYTEVLGSDYHLNVEYELSNFKNVSRAIDVVSSFIPEIKEVVLSGNLGVFDSELENNLGLTLGMDKHKSSRSILINKKHVDDSVDHIIATIVHEYDHYNTGYGDTDYREFRDVADKRIASLMMKFHVDNFFEIQNGVLVFPMSKISSIGSVMTFQIDKTDYISIIRVGEKTLYANHDIEYRGDCGEFDPVLGVLAINNTADGFIIPHLTNVKTAGVINHA